MLRFVFFFFILTNIIRSADPLVPNPTKTVSIVLRTLQGGVYLQTVQTDVINKLIDTKEKFSLGIISKDMSANDDIYDAIMDAVKTGHVDLQDNTDTYPKLQDLSLKEQEQDIGDCQSKIKTLWDVDTKVLALPDEHYNGNTLTAMKSLGLVYLSGSRIGESTMDCLHEYDDDPYIYNTPAGATMTSNQSPYEDLLSASEIMELIEKQMKKCEYAVLAITPKSFSMDPSEPKDETQDSQLDVLQDVIDKINKAGYAIEHQDKLYAEASPSPTPPSSGSQIGMWIGIAAGSVTGLVFLIIFLKRRSDAKKKQLPNSEVSGNIQQNLYPKPDSDSKISLSQSGQSAILSEESSDLVGKKGKKR